MKLMKLFAINCFLLSILTLQAQTYVFNSPQGYGSGVTGGGNSPVTIVTTRAALETALKASGSARIIVQGSIQVDYMSVEVHDKTLIGLPGARLYTNVQTAGASGIMNIKSSSNVIIRNLIFEGPGAYDSDGRDNLTFDGSTRMWVDHCDFQDGMDGNFDIKKTADNITVSWCRFRYLKAPKAGGSGGTNDHRFSNLVGSSDGDKPADDKFSVTWQYCWWDNGVVERMTRARNAQLHFLNCYWNSNTGKVILGLGGTTDAYVENSVFAGSGEKYRYYNNGTVRLTTIGSTAPPANVGTAPAPDYTHEVINASGVVSAVTGKCGAGATLAVTTSGAVSATCGGSTVTKYTLATSVNGTGTVNLNPAGGTYDEGTVVTVSAAPGSGYIFTGWSGGLTGTANPATITMNANKSVTANLSQAPTLTATSAATQSVTSGTAVSPVVYTWGGAATGVSVSGLPAGLSGTVNNSAKTYTISGTPTSSGTYVVSTVQTSGTGVSLSGKITVILSVPANVTAKAGISSVTLNWSAVTGATGYLISFCSVAGGSSACKEFTVAGRNVNTYTVSDLITGNTYTYQVKATNGVSAEASAYSAVKSITTGDPLGVEDTEYGKLSEATIYPNPALSVFHIGGVEGKALVSVSDMSGKLLFSKDVTANESISADALFSGMYMVKIVAGNRTTERKLIKK